MNASITIPCELTITPGGGHGQANKLRLSVSGETVFDDFENSLSLEELNIVRAIAKAHTRLLVKYGDDLLGTIKERPVARCS